MPGNVCSKIVQSSFKVRSKFVQSSFKVHSKFVQNKKHVSVRCSYRVPQTFIFYPPKQNKKLHKGWGKLTPVNSQSFFKNVVLRGSHILHTFWTIKTIENPVQIQFSPTYSAIIYFSSMYITSMFQQKNRRKKKNQKIARILKL